jgi:hypothetical protein
MTLATLSRSASVRTRIEEATRLLQQTADVLLRLQDEVDEERAQRTQAAVEAAEVRMAKGRERADREASQAAAERQWLSNLIKTVQEIEDAADATRATDIAMRLNVLRGQLMKVRASQ